MQLICEAYDILKTISGLSNDELAAIFASWNSTELQSFLIEITAVILAKKDDLTNQGHVVDKILDKTGMKGTGRWTVQEAAERNSPAPTMAAALDARYISARKEERIVASGILNGPIEFPRIDRNQLISDVLATLYCAKICSYAQGMNLIKSASEHHGWNINLGECARIWKGGCIIRAAFLDNIKEAYVKNAELTNLLIDPDFAASINSRQNSWRRVVSLCVASGIACPAMSSSLSYFDYYRRADLPTKLVQAQRDFFGGHTYERTDRPGQFHCIWDDSHKDIGDIASRIAGNL
jgi:6-phosphogluconate dehydrogenase